MDSGELWLLKVSRSTNRKQRENQIDMNKSYAGCAAKVCPSRTETKEYRIRTRQDETGCAIRNKAALQENDVAVINGNKFYIIQD
ncbi:hypothetical protein M3194_01930 [Paenibacillus glycanilyticus]|uniref:hypothetical protein n=1 Tax=Paenibacillus glycanilyticus TaxID=126569 RepID=UPI00203D528F|nr:hypothetical protein [Paenibacillus glycanilyticus]MCM3626125.1 hypothetical protein [Paenibacillus glycanilyticus]